MSSTRGNSIPYLCLGVGDMAKISYHDFFSEISRFTILSRFFVMLVLLFCKLSEYYSQTNFPIIKTKPFKVTTIPSFTQKLFLNLSEFLSSAEHKCYFEERGKPNSCLSTVTYIVFFSYYQIQCGPATVWFPTFFKISSFVFSTRNKLIQVWDNM